jgi:hypothetical protein
MGLTFDDAVTAGYLPANEEYGVYYCDGLYANYAAVRKRLPKAVLYAITVRGRTGKGVFACDCELGDLTVAEAIAWVEEQIRLEVPLICVYASADYWINQGLWDALAKYNSRIKRWVADYNGVKTTTITYEGRTYQFDAHQYQSDARLDYDIATGTFFKNPPKAKTPKPPKPKVNSGSTKFTGAVNFHADGTASLEIHKLAGYGKRQLDKTYVLPITVTVAKHGAHLSV